MAILSNINGKFAVESTGAIQFNGSNGTAGYILKSNGNASPTWVDASTVIGGPYLPLSGGTLTGATATSTGISFTVGGNLTVTGAATYGVIITTSGTQDTIKIDRAANTDNAITKYQTASTDKWIVGLRNTSDDNFRFYNYGTSSDSLIIDTSGNVGIGVTPEAWTGGTENALQIKNTGIYSYSDYETGIGTNMYYNSGWKYITTTTNNVNLHTQSNGNFTWYNAASGSADAAVTLTQRMQIDSNGNVTVGTANTSQIFKVNTPSLNTSFPSYLQIYGAYTSSISEINIEAVGVLSGGPYGSRLSFSTSDQTSLTKRLVIDPSGVVTVGASKRYVDSGNTQFDLEVTEGMAFGGAAYTFATIQGDSAGNGNIEICANAYPANTGVESTITFKTSTSAGGSYTPMTIKGDDVGIGTTSPTGKLEVVGKVAISDSGATSSMSMTATRRTNGLNGSAWVVIFAGISNGLSSASCNHVLVYGDNNAGAGYFDVLVVPSNGSVAPITISSTTTIGSPPSRQYDISSGGLRSLLASGTGYNVTVQSTGLGYPH